VNFKGGPLMRPLSIILLQTLTKVAIVLVIQLNSIILFGSFASLLGNQDI